ncbi:pilus assembly protein PilQ [Providencia burhodogranariea]|uniref:Type IV pilus assembly protein PilQ n=1 Tax=Providencia burhodogranariea DSM 19968 TaxID=1141662 RepID=K8WRP5_9GAMM|nr:pilus assembly protein PilQ [Providencia burhodogranariea]EKT63258.1 type IV pilus assembly protein PilQ [Providencia burhodogranariea DSM 19968]
MLTIESKADSILNILSTSDIVFNQRMIDTTVQLKDGDTLLIGGLIQHNAVNSSTSTPGASDIPLIGWLFDSNSKNEDIICDVYSYSCANSAYLVKSMIVRKSWL